MRRTISQNVINKNIDRKIIELAMKKANTGVLMFFCRTRLKLLLDTKCTLSLSGKSVSVIKQHRILMAAMVAINLISIRLAMHFWKHML